LFSKTSIGRLCRVIPDRAARGARRCLHAGSIPEGEKKMKIRSNTNFRTGLLLAAFLQLSLFGAFSVHAEMTKLA
jgi:hypothetical protein